MIINEDFFDDVNSEDIANSEVEDIKSETEKEYACQICLSIWDATKDYSNLSYEEVADKICQPLRKKVNYLFDYLPYIKEHSEPVFIIHIKNVSDISDKIYEHNGVLYKLDHSYCGHCSSAIQFNIKINHNIHSVKLAYKFAELLSNKLYSKMGYTYLDCGNEITPSNITHGLFRRFEDTLWHDESYAISYINNFKRWCEQLGFFPNGNDIRELLHTYSYEFDRMFNTEVGNIKNLKKINLKKEKLTDGSCIDSFLSIHEHDVEVSAMNFPIYRYDLNQGKGTYKALEDFRVLLDETPSEVILKPVFGKCCGSDIMSLIFIFKHLYQEVDSYDKSSKNEYNTMYAIRVDFEPEYLVSKYYDEDDITDFVNYMRPVQYIGFETSRIITEIFKRVQGTANKTDVNNILKKVKEAEAK